MTWNGAELDWLIILVFGGTALWCLLVSPVKKWRFEQYAKRAVWATARVVARDSRTSRSYGDSNSEPVTTYYADLQFTTEDGRQFEVEREVAEGVRVGAEVPVAYHVENPSDARLDWTYNKWSGGSWIAGVLGFLIFAGLGFGMLWGIGAIEVG